MRIARIAAAFVLLVAGPAPGALAEDLSGKLAELESGAKAPSDKVQIVPGVEQPAQHAGPPTTAPEAEPAAASEPAADPEDDAEGAQAEDEPNAESEAGGMGLTVEPHVPNATKP